MGLREIEATLPPGFRFYPKDEDLVCHYLYNKIINNTDQTHLSMGTMVDVNLHTCEPWQLPDIAKLGDNEWYFFSFRDRKYATGPRSNRATTTGYWKATGKDKPVFDPMITPGRVIVGMRKTLVFYCGRAPNGIKTAWVMHEFRLENYHTCPKEDWVLCRVFHKDNKGDQLTHKLIDIERGYMSNDAKMGVCSKTISTSSMSSSSSISIDHQLQAMASGPHQLITLCQEKTTPSSNCLPDLVSVLDPPNMREINTGTRDEYGFLLDLLNLEEGNAGPSSKFDENLFQNNPLKYI